MIIDVITNRQGYAGLSPGIDRALEFLEGTDFSSLEDGVHAIEGEDIYAILASYDTEPETERRFEAHRKYLDVQCLLSGREIILWAPTQELTLTDEYSPEKDVLFLAGQARARLHLKAGSFAVFYPEDAHKPNCAWDQPVPVRKVVVKVRVG